MGTEALERCPVPPSVTSAALRVGLAALLAKARVTEPLGGGHSLWKVGVTVGGGHSLWKVGVTVGGGQSLWKVGQPVAWTHRNT